jgi:hypothetical protein
MGLEWVETIAMEINDMKQIKMTELELTGAAECRMQFGVQARNLPAVFSLWAVNMGNLGASRV